MDVLSLEPFLPISYLSYQNNMAFVQRRSFHITLTRDDCLLTEGGKVYVYELEREIQLDGYLPHHNSHASCCAC